jgi:tetratricopeptide (TPR) repeat protein
MLEFEQVVNDLERDLSLERCRAALPTLLELCKSDPLAKTRALLLMARCAFVSREAATYELYLQKAAEASNNGPLEAKVRVALLEASLLTASAKYTESEQKLQFAFENLISLAAETQGLTHSIHGRNLIQIGAYVEAIDHSQEAIALSPPLSSAAAFAHGTIAMTFQAMGRINESEHYALEQIRILSGRGSHQWVPSIYTLSIHSLVWVLLLSTTSKRLKSIVRRH